MATVREEEELDSLRKVEFQMNSRWSCNCRACVHQRLETLHGMPFTWDPKNCARYNEKAW